MFNKTAIAGIAVVALGTGLAEAQQLPASPPTYTGNVSFFSQYIFRGLTRTDKEPALQGGMDYSHTSGFYAGTWGSNISWLRDFGSYSAGGSLELDIYGGFKGTFGKSDFGYDAGLLYYWYPGEPVAGGTDADTLEVYGALSWKWLSAKLSYSLLDETFGVRDSRGTYYLDFTVNFPIPNTKLTLIGHYGIQKFDGSSTACTTGRNDDCASYEDWKVGVNYFLPKDFTVGVFYTDTSMTAAQQAFYTTPASAGGRFVGKGTTTVFVQKTF